MKVGSGSAALVLIAASSVGITANARQDGQAPAVVSSPSQPPQSVALTADGIIVRGQAQVPLQPDLARITFQVRATGTDHDRAQQDSRTLAAKTQAALLRAGVAEKDVVIADQRGGFALIGAAPSGEPSAGSEPKRVYSAVTEIRTTVRNLVGLGNVLTAAYEAGANGPVYLSYELNDEKAARKRGIESGRDRGAGKGPGHGGGGRRRDRAAGRARRERAPRACKPRPISSHSTAGDPSRDGARRRAASVVMSWEPAKC
jgi:uncharacterized protein YggE